MMIALGKDPDAKPDLTAMPDLARKLQDSPQSDEELFFSGDADKEHKGRKIKPEDSEL